MEETFKTLTSLVPLPEQLLPPPANHWINTSTFPVTQDEAVMRQTVGASEKVAKQWVHHRDYLKALPSAGARLLEIITEFWHTEELPEDWFLGRLTMLHKKGCKNNPNNYRAICILSHAYKILSSILLCRIAVVHRVNKKKMASSQQLALPFKNWDKLKT